MVENMWIKYKSCGWCYGHLVLGTCVQVVLFTNGTYNTGMDAWSARWYMTCITVCVSCTPSVGVHGWGEITGWFPGVETDPKCKQRQDKGETKDKYHHFISVLVYIWHMILIYDGYI